MSLYIENLKDRKFKNIEEMFHELFHGDRYRGSSSTRFASTGSQQCHAGASRSIDDIVRVGNYYFPRRSDLSIIKSLTKYVFDDNVKKRKEAVIKEKKAIRELGVREYQEEINSKLFIYCPDVSKWVLQLNWTLHKPMYGLAANYLKPVCNNYHRTGNGKYSLEDILDVKGIIPGPVINKKYHHYKLFDNSWKS